MIEIRKAENQEDRDRCLSIRRRTFISEMNIPESIEIDEYDEPESSADHFLILENDEPVSTFRSKLFDAESRKLQRICTYKEYRGMGYGRASMEYAISYYRESGYKRLVLDAQEKAVGFYLKCGFKVISEMFYEADIPHYRMEYIL